MFVFISNFLGNRLKKILLQLMSENFQFVVIHTVKDFGVVSKADVFLEFSCFFYDPTDVVNLISGSLAFSKFSLNILKSMVHVLLRSCLENLEHYFAVWEMSAIVW